MQFLNNLTTYLGYPLHDDDPSPTSGDPGIPHLHSAPEPLTLGNWLESNHKTAQQVKEDPFLLNRVSHALLHNKGIKDATEHQLHETRFALIEALKSDTWQDFTSPSIPGVIDVEVGAGCCPGNVFFERDGYALTELTSESLKLTPGLERQLHSGYSDGTLGQIIAGTFIDGKSRSSSDFSHTSGDEAWTCYLQAWTMLRQLPQGEFLSTLDVHLLTRTNQLLFPPDTNANSTLYRTVESVMPGTLAPPARGIRQGAALTQYETLSAEEVKNLNLLGLPFHGYPLPLTGNQRGYTEFPPPETLDNRLFEIITELRANLSTSSPDEIGACTRFCQQLVALHPFSDSNNQTALLIMNRLLTELGYPPAILSTLHTPLHRSATHWEDKVREGIAHTQRYLEKARPFPLDSYLAQEKRSIIPPDQLKRIVLDGIPLSQGLDGFLYDVSGRPYLVEKDTLKPLSQLEYFFIARRLICMPREEALNKLRELTVDNNRLARHSEAGTLPKHVHLHNDIEARRADSQFELRGDFFATRILVDLLSVVSQ